MVLYTAKIYADNIRKYANIFKTCVYICKRKRGVCVLCYTACTVPGTGSGSTVVYFRIAYWLGWCFSSKLRGTCMIFLKIRHNSNDFSHS